MNQNKNNTSDLFNRFKFEMNPTPDNNNNQKNEPNLNNNNNQNNEQNQNNNTNNDIWNVVCI